MQRQLMGALVSSVAVTLLLLALMPVMALGQSANCPAGYDHKSDPPEDITPEWGSATLVNSGSAVEFHVKDGYTVAVCVKGGNKGFAEDIIVGEDTVVVSTPTDQDVSHYEWTVTPTATTTTTTVVATTPTGDTTTTSEGATTSSTAIGGTSSTSEATASTLPFTGPSDMGLLVAAGLALLALGGAALRMAD